VTPDSPLASLFLTGRDRGSPLVCPRGAYSGQATTLFGYASHSLRRSKRPATSDSQGARQVAIRIESGRNAEIIAYLTQSPGAVRRCLADSIEPTSALYVFRRTRAARVRLTNLCRKLQRDSCPHKGAFTEPRLGATDPEGPLIGLSMNRTDKSRTSQNSRLSCHSTEPNVSAGNVDRSPSMLR